MDINCRVRCVLRGVCYNAGRMDVPGHLGHVPDVGFTDVHRRALAVAHPIRPFCTSCSNYLTLRAPLCFVAHLPLIYALSFLAFSEGQGPSHCAAPAPSVGSLSRCL